MGVKALLALAQEPGQLPNAGKFLQAGYCLDNLAGPYLAQGIPGQSGELVPQLLVGYRVDGVSVVGGDVFPQAASIFESNGDLGRRVVIASEVHFRVRHDFHPLGQSKNFRVGYLLWEEGGHA